MEIVIQLTVKFDEKTTRLTAKEHKDAICSGLFRAIGDGLLTAHEPMAEVDTYKIE